jgi:membrane-associated phospholipid phosphatase
MAILQSVRELCRAVPAPRNSPVSCAATLLTFTLLAIGVVASIATGFTLKSLPNIILLVTGIVVLDVLSQFLPRVRIVASVQTILYGILYLIITCVCGVLAAYALQRLAFPLRDVLLTRADLALGFHWLDYARWVDRHPDVQAVVRFAYDSIALQIALPVLVLGLSARAHELRIYILAFAFAFVATIVVSALMPAAGPIAMVDRASFDLLRFTGATPIDHLTRLREAGPLVMTEFPGGIATFPSFHSTVAVLTPLALRSHRRIFVVLALFNLAMLAGTLTEGAHYLIDVLAGIGMAFLGYALARRVLAREERMLARMRVRPAAGELAAAPLGAGAP